MDKKSNSFCFFGSTEVAKQPFFRPFFADKSAFFVKEQRKNTCRRRPIWQILPLEQKAPSAIAIKQKSRPRGSAKMNHIKLSFGAGLN